MIPDIFFIDSLKEWYIVAGLPFAALQDQKATSTVGKTAEFAWRTVTWPVAAYKFQKELRKA